MAAILRDYASAAIVCLAASLLLGQPIHGDDWSKMKSIQPKGYVAYRLATAPRIDGRLDEETWRAIPWTDDFQDIEGARKPPPRFQTRAKIAWDDQYLYVAAELKDPDVWGTLREHDAVIFHDNDFEVFIDPDGDHHEYYEFEMNALNTGWDLFLPRPYSDGGKADNGWEIPGLKTAVHVQGTLNQPADRDSGWTLEIAMPWPVLGEYAHRATPPANGDQWRINFSRVQWQHEVKDGKYVKRPGTKEDNWVWSAQGIVNMHRPERWGFVQFSTARPGTDTFAADGMSDVRERLLGFYHLQKAYRGKHNRWATSLEELGLPEDDSGFALRETPNGYEASLPLIQRDDKPQRIAIRQDGRLTVGKATETVTDAVERVIGEQAAAWNRGDIESFMQHYWKSPQLSFSSGGTTRRGWEATRKRYLARYPDRDRMGKLTFSELHVSVLSSQAAQVLGRWQLERTDPIGGNFSLVFRRIDGRWVIAHDHTSVDDEDK